MTLLGKKDYDLTKTLITATTLLFVTRPTRFWQALHSAQGTMKPGKTWSGETFLFNHQETWVANIFSTFRRELEILTQKRREVQGRQVDINRDNRKSLENAIDMQLQLLQVLTMSSTLEHLQVLSISSAQLNMRCRKICDFSPSANKDSSLHSSIHYRRSWTKQLGKRSQARVLRWTWTSPQILWYSNNTNTLYDVL